jgi:hypothetical protein
MDLSALTPLRRHLIAQANSLINWLLDAVEDALAPGVRRTLPGLKSLYRNYLVPPEAALRRALHSPATDLPVPAKKQPKTQPKPSAHSREGGNLKPQSSRPGTPTFRLGEPQPRPKTDHLPARLTLRISLIGVTPRPAPPAPRRKLNEADLEAQLRRRLDALNAAFANPLAAVRRLQRRLAKPVPARPKLAAAIPGHTSPRLAGDGPA